MEAKEKNRKQYKKPQVSQVKIEIDEAVLAACKLNNNDPARAGTGNPRCSDGSLASSCKTTLGS